MDEHIRLADVDDEKDMGDEDWLEAERDYDALELEDLSKVIPIRGRTMGFMGPTNSIRVALYKFLVYRCVVCLVLTVVLIDERRL